MRVNYIYLPVVIFLFGCSSCSSASLPSPTVIPAIQIIPSTKVPDTNIEILATPIKPHFLVTGTQHICSPLAIQPLDKLTEIITQPFIMPLLMQDGSYSDGGHHGLDLGFVLRGKQRFLGTPILSAIDGKVASIIRNRPPYGNMVMLETSFDNIPPQIVAAHSIPPEDSLYTVYAHLQNLQPLEIGQIVKCGHQIAEAGLTGITSGPHLHLETRWGPANSTFSSMGAYRGDITPDEMKVYKLWRMSHTYQLFDPFELINP